MRIIETGNARFIEDTDNSESLNNMNVIFEEERTMIPITVIPSNVDIHPVVEPLITTDHYDEPLIQPTEEGNKNPIQENEPLRRSHRERRPAIPNDYIVYLQEHEFDIGVERDPESFTQVKQSINSS